MATSHWNQFLDRLLSERLTVAEYRLALTLARLTLGWKQSAGHYLGRELIRSTSGLDGRAFDRARDGLIAKGFLRYTPGKPGRGNRAHYELILGSEKAALQRPFLASVKGRSTTPEKAALQRPRRVKKQKGKNSEQENELRRRAFDAYLGAGGTLLLDRERGALARSVKSAVKEGKAEADILAACRDLGRNREFPGLLKQRVTELLERGGACDWEGLDRARLKSAQLSECGCNRCAEWLIASSTPVNHEGASG